MHGRRILMADDDPVVQTAVRCAAADRGYEVIPATNGAEVMALAIRTQPALIVLDLTFADADGRDILTHLKADARTRNTPVLVWSARNRGSDRKICLELGAEDYMEKADADTLLGRIKRVLLRIEAEKRA